jgi:hypothetical protein
MRTYLSVANPEQLAEIAVGAHGARHELPPAGMSRGFDIGGPGGVAGVNVVSGLSDLYVEGDTAPADQDRWYWGTLGSFISGLSGIDSAALNRLLTSVAGVAGTPLGGALDVPLLKKGSAGSVMRWIRSTYRGILGGGVEEFQFKIDLGNPGADPDLDAAGCALLAEQLAGLWGPGNNPQFLNAVTTEAQMTEVGVVTMTATSATAKDGSGGNMAQSFPTEWFMWPTGSRPSGSAGVSLPYECACAVTLQTDKRGPSGRGRFYLPPFGTSQMTAGGVFDSAAQTNAEHGSLLWLEAIRDATPYDVIVVSPRQLVLNKVTSVNVGKVPDSQRRRRRSQDEARLSEAMSA